MTEYGKRQRKSFSLIEVVVAIGVTAVLLTCFSTVNTMAFSAQRRAVRKYEALVVLDNVVERMSGSGTITIEELRRAVAAEFEKSDLATTGATIRWQCKDNGGSGTVILEAGPGNTVAQVEVPLR